MTTIYRAEVIGSLLRPGYLTEARKARDAGKLTEAEFKKTEDRAVDEALALQERAGVDVITDGEMRRTIFTQPLTGILEGLSPIGSAAIHWRRKEGEVRREMENRHPFFTVVSKIRRKQWLVRDEFVYARDKAAKPLKVTMPGPTMALPLWSPQHSTAAYPSAVELFADAADILREEIRELAALGCKYIQIDAPELTWLADDVRLRELYAVHPKLPDWMRNEGIDALNSLADVPGITFGLHMCRGNFQGYWISEAPWQALSKQVLRRMSRFDVFLLEYDDWRSGSFEALKDVPGGKTAALGLISTKRTELEPADEIIARIEEAARYFPREQLALSTQCGFAPEPHGSAVDESSQEAKLRLVAGIANRVWR